MADKIQKNTEQMVAPGQVATPVAAPVLYSYYSERLSQTLGPNGVFLPFINNRHITTDPDRAKFLDNVISTVSNCGFHKE